MTAFQSEIDRIIRTFSAIEREKFARMGGSLPNVAAPEPEWFRPGVDALPVFKGQQHEPRVKVQLDGGMTLSIREAAQVLNVGEGHLRNRINKADEIEVRGVTVKRTAPRRGQEKAA